MVGVVPASRKRGSDVCIFRAAERALWPVRGAGTANSQGGLVAAAKIANSDKKDRATIWVVRTLEFAH
eukprot:14584451-Alexandrium_andersonii.AAC.1